MEVTKEMMEVQEETVLAKSTKMVQFLSKIIRMKGKLSLL